MIRRTITAGAATLILGLAALAGCGSPAAPDAAPPELGIPVNPLPGTGQFDNATPVSLRVYHPGKEGTPTIASTRSTWVPLGLQASGEIQVPAEKTPQVLGWYCPGRVAGTTHLPNGNCMAPVPGAMGPAVVIGHINGDGHDGVFRHLDQVKKGDVIDVGMNTGKIVRFVASDAGMPAKTAFPSDKVYGNTDTPEIRLISCGGRLDPRYNEGVQYHRYIDQVIVWGRLAPDQPKQ